MAFSRGKHSKAISDRSGMAFPYSEMVKEWNGMLVHISEYESKQPQLDVEGKGSDPQALQDARTDRTENAVAALMPHDPFTTYAASSSVINVNSPDPATFDGIAGSNIAKAAGYAITTGKYVGGSRDTDFTSDWFYFTVDTSTATTGGITGGGFPVSVGPATLSA